MSSPTARNFHRFLTPAWARPVAKAVSPSSAQPIADPPRGNAYGEPDDGWGGIQWMSQMGGGSPGGFRVADGFSGQYPNLGNPQGYGTFQPSNLMRPPAPPGQAWTAGQQNGFGGGGQQPPAWDWESQPIGWDAKWQRWDDGLGGIRTLPNGVRVAVMPPAPPQNRNPQQPPVQQTFQQPVQQQPQAPQPQYGPGEDLAKVQQKKREAFAELGNMRRELLLLKNRREQVDYAGRLRGDDIKIANEIQAMEDRIQEYARQNGIRGGAGGVAVF